MKLFNSLAGIMLFYFASSISPITINGRFTVLDSTNSKLTVLLQINSNSGIDDLGGATLVFGFDTTAISFASDPVTEGDYIFHNFNNGNYSSATLTRPVANQIWVNIDLPFINSNNGTVVVINPEWTNVVTINFNILNSNRAAKLTWLTISPFWGVYDADNSTLWQTGVFENYSFSIEPVSGSPDNFELSQNYPNPFNPSTKINFTIPFSGTNQAVPVRLKVYDILGNEVATLVDEEKEPGIYEVEFSPSSGSSNIASGIYIYRIESADFVDTKKMVLLK